MREGNQEVSQPVRLQSKTRLITGMALFVAISVSLSVSRIQIPFPLLPFLFYELWEIPIIASFLMLGGRPAIVVAVINTVVLLLANQGAATAGPIYNFAAVILTLSGVFVAQMVARRRLGVAVGLATVLGVLVRVVGMTLVNRFLLVLGPPLGFNLPVGAVIPILPLIALFNATLAAYTIPIAYGVVGAIARRYKLRLAYPFRLSRPN